VKADDVRYGVVMVHDFLLSEVFPYSRFDPENAVHLVVFPWAGASALSCLRLCSVVGEAVGVLAVEMAGRGTRGDEPAVRTVEDVAAEVTSALVDIMVENIVAENIRAVIQMEKEMENLKN